MFRGLDKEPTDIWTILGFLFLFELQIQKCLETIEGSLFCGLSLYIHTYINNLVPKKELCN